MTDSVVHEWGCEIDRFQQYGEPANPVCTCALDDAILTNAEWHAFQQIPDQGYSHRFWIDTKIRERVEAALAARENDDGSTADAWTAERAPRIIDDDDERVSLEELRGRIAVDDAIENVKDGIEFQDSIASSDLRAVIEAARMHELATRMARNANRRVIELVNRLEAMGLDPYAKPPYDDPKPGDFKIRELSTEEAVAALRECVELVYTASYSEHRDLDAPATVEYLRNDSFVIARTVQ